MGKVNVDVNEVLDEVSDALKTILNDKDTGKAPIDTDDADAVGELIKEQGWTAYDLSIDLEDFADPEQLAQATNMGAMLGEHGLKDVIEGCIDHKGSEPTLREVMRQTECQETVDALMHRWDNESVLAAVLSKLNFEGDDAVDVRVVLQGRDADILRAIGKDCVMEAIKAMGWLVPVAPPKPTTKVIGALEWQCTPAKDLRWEMAQALALSMMDGWRLPTVQELLSLWDYPANACPEFPLYRGCLWSADKRGEGAAWRVNFDSGDVLHYVLAATYDVRLVRDVKKAE